MARSRRDDDDYDDEIEDGYERDRREDRRRRRRRQQDQEDAVGFLVPTKVSPYAIIGCYAGLIGFCIPLFGFPFALVGFVCSIIAIRRWKNSGGYGGATSNARAIIGVVLSSLGLLGSIVFLIFLALDKIK